MTRYVALLRGVNVGGRTVRMEDVRTSFAGLGHGDVTTHIQSGNVLFDAKGTSRARIERELEQRLASDLGLTTTVLLRTANELSDVIAANPFVDRTTESTKLLVTFLSSAPDDERVRALTTPGGEPAEFSVIGSEVYLFCPDGYGRTKLNNTFFERKLGVAATTRNWNVVNKLLALAST